MPLLIDLDISVFYHAVTLKKATWNAHRLANNQSEIAPYQVAICGSVSGAIAAAATTPLDVIKTRIMLKADAQGVPYKGVQDVAVRLLEESKQAAVAANTSVVRSRLSTFFAGVQPRVMWIAIGGFVFFGSYDYSFRTISAYAD